MSKITLNNLANLQNEDTAVSTINSNNSTIQTAFDNTLSRDGTQPNAMMNNLDMNSFQIMNLPAPGSASAPARLQDVTGSVVISSVPPVGTSGAVVGFLNGNNTHSGNNTFSGNNTLSGNNTYTGTNTYTNASPITVGANSGNNGLINFKGATSGTTILQSNTTASGTLTLPAATDTLTGKATTDTLTNKTLDTAGTGNVIKFGGVTSSTVTGTGAVTLANTPTLITPNIGAATGTSLAATGKITSSSPSQGVGYATGAGTSVTQLTSKTTAVTANTMSGAITMFATGSIPAGIGNATAFQLTNSNIAISDMVLVSHPSGGTQGAYVVWADGYLSGSCKINVGNVTAGALTEAPVINFLIIKGVTS